MTDIKAGIKSFGSGLVPDSAYTWRLDYGQSREIGEYVLHASITVEKGAKLGTAIAKIAHQEFSQGYKAYCSAMSAKTVKAGSAVDYLGKVLRVDATGVEFSGAETGGKTPLRVQYGKPQAYTFGEYVLTETITVTAEKGTAPGTAVVTFSP